MPLANSLAWYMTSCSNLRSLCGKFGVFYVPWYDFTQTACAVWKPFASFMLSVYLRHSPNLSSTVTLNSSLNSLFFFLFWTKVSVAS